MLKLKAVARQIHARNQTLSSIASREEPPCVRPEKTSLCSTSRAEVRDLGTSEIANTSTSLAASSKL
jgi:hypothetical protein